MPYFRAEIPDYMFEQLIRFLTPYCQSFGLPDAWLKEVDFWVFLCATLFSGVLLPLLVYTVKLIRWIILRQKQRLLERDLHPWYTPGEIDRATRFYVPTHYQNVSPSQDDEPGRRYIATARNALIPLFLRKTFGKTDEDNKYYLILADSGMGKSTFMINLYLAYKRQWSWFRPKYQIKLLPLGHPHALADLDKMDDKEKERTILLLDAFDEDVQALHNYQKRMEEILEKSWRFREVVITCRTQFFPSREEEPHETGHYKFGGAGGDFKFQKLYLSVFDDRDVWKYLLKRYNMFNPFKWRRLYKAWRITQKSPNLVVRPMLLSHIEDLVKENREYEFAYQIYEVLIRKWIQRESNKPGIREKYGNIEVFQQKLEQLSHHLAIDMYRNQETRGGLFIPKDQPVFSDSGVALDDLFEEPGIAMKDSEWRTRSLLNRNAEGQYKFAHKSILEYFLTKEAFRDNDFAGALRFEGMEAAKGFYYQMVVSTLRNLNGGFNLPYSKTYPLTKLTPKNLGQASSLTIRSIEGLPILMLADFVPKTILSIAIFDKTKYPSYYTLFCWLISGLIEPLYLHIELSEIQKHLLPDLGIRLGWIKILNTLDRQMFKARLSLPDILEQGDLRERLNRLNAFEKKSLLRHEGSQEFINLLELLQKLKNKNPEILAELKAANEFIKQCKALQKAMPNTIIYY